MAEINSIKNLNEARTACEDLIGVLQDIHYKLSVIEDLSDYGVVESFIEYIETALSRYDALD